MTDRQSDFVEELLGRLDANDRELEEATSRFEEARDRFAAAQARHAERRQAIKLLLEAEGHVVEDAKESDPAQSDAPSSCVVHEDALRRLRNELVHYSQRARMTFATRDEAREHALMLCTAHQTMRDLDVFLNTAPQPNGFAMAWTKLNEMDVPPDRTQALLRLASCRTWGRPEAAADMLSMIQQIEDAHIEDPESATTRDFVRQALIQAGGPVRMVDVVEAVKKMGSTASADTVRSVLQKMLHSGEAERPERGLYAYKIKSARSVRSLEDEPAFMTAAPQEVEPDE